MCVTFRYNEIAFGRDLNEEEKRDLEAKEARAKEKAKEDARLQYRKNLRDRTLNKMVKASKSTHTPTAAGRATMVVRAEYIETSDDELTVKPGELVQIISSSVTAGQDNDDIRHYDQDTTVDPG